MTMKSEDRVQQEIVLWFRNNFCLNHHNPKHLIFSVPNERKDTRELMKLKATGLLGGVSDLIVLMPQKVLFIEVKNDIGRQSEKQIKFENDVKKLGFEYFLVRNLEEFKQIINKY